MTDETQEELERFVNALLDVGDGVQLARDTVGMINWFLDED